MNRIMIKELCKIQWKIEETALVWACELSRMFNVVFMLSSCVKSYSRRFLLISKIRPKLLTYESHKESFEKHKKNLPQKEIAVQ